MLSINFHVLTVKTKRILGFGIETRTDTSTNNYGVKIFVRENHLIIEKKKQLVLNIIILCFSSKLLKLLKNIENKHNIYLKYVASYSFNHGVYVTKPY